MFPNFFLLSRREEVTHERENAFALLGDECMTQTCSLSAPSSNIELSSTQSEKPAKIIYQKTADFCEPFYIFVLSKVEPITIGEFY